MKAGGFRCKLKSPRLYASLLRTVETLDALSRCIASTAGVRLSRSQLSRLRTHAIILESPAEAEKICRFAVGHGALGWTEKVDQCWNVQAEPHRGKNVPPTWESHERDIRQALTGVENGTMDVVAEDGSFLKRLLGTGPDLELPRGVKQLRVRLLRPDMLCSMAEWKTIKVSGLSDANEASRRAWCRQDRQFRKALRRLGRVIEGSHLTTFCGIRIEGADQSDTTQRTALIVLAAYEIAAAPPTLRLFPKGTKTKKLHHKQYKTLSDAFDAVFAMPQQKRHEVPIRAEANGAPTPMLVVQRPRGTPMRQPT